MAEYRPAQIREEIWEQLEQEAVERTAQKQEPVTAPQVLRDILDKFVARRKRKAQEKVASDKAS